MTVKSVLGQAGGGPDAFLTNLGTAQTTVGAMSTDLDGYAHDCKATAGHLEREADDVEARRKQASHPRSAAGARLRRQLQQAQPHAAHLVAQ